MKGSLVTLAVVYHNEEINLPPLLESISSELKKEKEKFQLLFIDNNSTDQSAELIDKWIIQQAPVEAENVRRQFNHMANARQQVLEISETPWIVFIDADSTLNQNWSQQLLKVIETTPETVAVVGGGSIYSTSEFWHKFVLPLAAYFPLGKRAQQRAEVSHVPTNNCLIHREKALAVGGFDSYFKTVGEDLDLTVRLRKKFEVHYYPIFSVTHRLPTYSEAWYRKMAMYGRAQSYVFLKYRGEISSLKFIPLLLVIGLVTAIFKVPSVSFPVLVISLVIPRTRFFLLTFMFYGLGELVGAIKFTFSYKFLQSFVTKENRLQ